MQDFTLSEAAFPLISSEELRRYALWSDALIIIIIGFRGDVCVVIIKMVSILVDSSLHALMTSMMLALLEMNLFLRISLYGPAILIGVHVLRLVKII